MKQIHTITMPEDKNYLSEFMTELPTGIFNKKVTNTGATTLVLENEQDVILVSPTNNLIANKIRQYPNKRCKYELFAVNGGVTTADIITYINRCEGKQPVKLISTPDSLYKITCLTDVYKNYHLIVDEFHELLKMMGNRKQAALRLMEDFNKFTKYTFLSATPIKENFLPYPLNALDYYTLKVENFERVKAVPRQSNKPFATVCDIIKNFKMKGELLINGNSTKHLYFYINSVTNICSVIKNSGLEAKDVNIICADTPANERKLSIVGCEIGEFITEDELQKNPLYESPIHFITSTAFQGSDIYSNDGIAFFVTDCHVKSTMSGMATLQQISGQIRTMSNPFNGLIYHIYNINKASLTYDEYLKEQQVDINKAIEIINSWDILPQSSKDNSLTILKHAEILEEVVYYYYDKMTDRIYLNDLKIKSDQSKHEAENLIYMNGIEVRKAYVSEGFSDLSANYLKIETDFKNFIKHQDFKSYCKAYDKSLNEKYYIGEPLFGCPDITQKLIKTAFLQLGYKKIVDLKYHQTSIKQEIKVSLSLNTLGVIQAVNKTFTIGGLYNKTEAKNIMQATYNKLGIIKTAKSTSLKEYFVTKESKLPDGNNGILIVKRLNNIITDTKQVA